MWARVYDIIARMGGEVLDECLSRVDLCVDLPGLSVDEACEAWRLGRDIRRARYCDVHQMGRRFTGLSIGRGDIACRIYDKLEELTQSGDEVKFALLLHGRWGGEVPEAATRVEFQLRRGALREFGIRTMQDWWDRRAGVAAYLTGEWLRFAGEDVDRRNPQRAVTAAWWREVGEAFAAWAGAAAVLERVREVKATGEGLMRQAMGCLVSACALTADQAVIGTDEFLGMLINQAERMIGSCGGRLLREFNRRRERFAAAGLT